MTRTALVVAAALATVTLTAAVASAAPVPAGVQAGSATQAGVQAHSATADGGAPCNVGVPVIGGVLSTITNAACSVGNTVLSGVGDVVSGVGDSVLGVVASWLIGAATAITRFVAAQMTATTTPALASSWYQSQFAPMADLGAGLALLVALVALGSAALRRSPDALAATLTATVRAGLGTGLIVALTAIGLSVADQVSTAVIGNSPHAFWNTVALAWGHTGFGGFGSSALAALIALVEVFGALLVWLELIVRGAAIYIAVLFFPVALAASIWPPLAGWTSRLGRLLLLLVVLKPVTLIVLSLAGNAAAAGLSLSAGGVPSSVGTILAAIVIFALAAFAPWTLMYLLAADAESAWTAGALRAGTGQTVNGQSGRSVRTGGGLANLTSRNGTSGGDGGGAAGGGGGPRGPGGGGRSSPGGGSGGGGDRGPRPGSPGLQSADGTSGAAASGAGTGGAVGGGAVGAAAGIRAGRRQSARPSQVGSGRGSETPVSGASCGSAASGGRDGAAEPGASGIPSARAVPSAASAAPAAGGSQTRGGSREHLANQSASTSPTRPAPTGARTDGGRSPSGGRERTGQQRPTLVRKPPPPPRSAG